MNYSNLLSEVMGEMKMRDLSAEIVQGAEEAQIERYWKDEEFNPVNCFSKN